MPPPPAKARSATGSSRITAPRPSGEWAWGGMGIGVATASAGFAAYMVVLSPPESASGDFRVFASFDHRFHSSADRPGLASAAAPATPSRPADEPAPAGDIQASMIDFAPTGAIGPLPGGERPGTGPSGSAAAPAVPLPDFTLRDVFDGKALVQTRASLSVVRPGSLLEGAGAVLSIEKRDGRWVVTTERGLIVGEHR